MLDNLQLKIPMCCEIADGRGELESSGGITFDTIREYALAGVDYISVGALTSVKSLDMSLKAV